MRRSVCKCEKWSRINSKGLDEEDGEDAEDGEEKADGEDGKDRENGEKNWDDRCIGMHNGRAMKMGIPHPPHPPYLPHPPLDRDVERPLGSKYRRPANTRARGG